MTDLQQPSRQTVVTELNETPLSQTLADLLKTAKVDLWPNKLVIVHLLEWALENQAADPSWSEAASAAVNLAAQEDPEALYENLESSRLDEATTLEQAGLAIISSVLDLIPAGTSPA